MSLNVSPPHARAQGTVHQRLQQLLDYVLEQDRDIDPHSFCLSSHPGWVRAAWEVNDLPGVVLDEDVAGDHVWLRVSRLTSEPAPPLDDARLHGLVEVSASPDGPPPTWREAALRRYWDEVFEASASSSHRPTATGPARAATSPAVRGADGTAVVAGSAASALAHSPQHTVSAAWEVVESSAPALPSASPGAGRLGETTARQRAQAVLDAALADYTQQWMHWARSEAPKRRAMRLYAELFELKHQLDAQAVAQAQELVWGWGIVAWKTAPPAPVKAGVNSRMAASGAERETGVHVQYPLLTQAMELSIDEETLAIELRPRALDPRLELDAFSACGLPGMAQVERGAAESLARLREQGLSPFEPSGSESLLRWMVGRWHQEGRYVSQAQQWPAPQAVPVVADTWVILARPKANKDTHADIARLKAVIDDHDQAGQAMPQGVGALVTPPADTVAQEAGPVLFRGRSGCTAASGHGQGQAVHHELYFPLPYNAEQMTIVEQLFRHSGVAVQGPPGTGKTHTIANIVCHYLATGRKVLVTAKGQQALEVLQSKIPPAVRPLTVALLAGDREGLRQFQASIEAILHNVSQLQPAAVKADIRAQQARIDQAHTELALIDRRTAELAQAQLGEIDVDGLSLRAQQMADLVVTGADQHAWFDDDLSMDPDHAPPLDAAQTALLRQTRRQLGNDLVYATHTPPVSSALPEAADVAQWHVALQDLATWRTEVEAGRLWPLRSASTAEGAAHRGTLSDDEDDLSVAVRTLQTHLEDALDLAQTLEAAQAPWAQAWREKCLQARFDSEREALEALFDDWAALVHARGEFLRQPVDLPDSILNTPKAREALARAAQTGRPFGWLSLGQAEVRTQISAVRVAGLPPQQAQAWQHVQRYVDLHDRVLSFCVRWNAVAPALSIPGIQPGGHALREIEHIGMVVRKAHQLAMRHDVAWHRVVAAVFAQQAQAGPWDPQHTWGSVPWMQALRHQVHQHLSRATLSPAVAARQALQETVDSASGPVSVALQTWAHSVLGDPAQRTEDVVSRYNGLVAEVRRLEGMTQAFDTVHALAERFAQAGAVRLAQRLRTRPVSATGDDTVLPTHWREAWIWARVKARLDDIDGRDELRRLATRRHELEAVLAQAYEWVVAQSAWLSTKQGASPRVLSALETYRTAVRRIGQGTGPNAVRHRRDAQRAMHDAQAAVPCWIMTHAKVSETMPAALGAFDLVIVDEASQSDLWALPAILRGQQILVVGDDKQVSPDGSFMSAARIQDLKDRFLEDQPFAAVLTPEKSMYDIAATVFAASKVMLREHFRCVPPIIAYSNRHFYKDFIQPLRIPQASERLDPPLVDIFVPAGRRDAHDINREEALAIVAEIQAILKDTRLQGRTLGVVSLLGPNQAQYIDKLVRTHCDPADLLKRKFECGDARVFQGSERDIMFLSLVASPGDCRALSGNMFDQRFNVAASRARDRMILVRSVQASDLSSVDLRAGLLDHFGAPQPETGGQPVDSTAARADADESNMRLDALCESGFEREVYTELFERGYRVVPQVKAGSFRIDMVVEGGGDARLAIECDGDAFHGLDRWHADMSRQRVLERAGWTFWRCFASTWTMRREEVLQDLLDTLESMGIEPLGGGSQLPSWVEHREWSSLELASVHEAMSQA